MNCIQFQIPIILNGLHGFFFKLPVVKAIEKLWMIFEPLMFGLIGAEIKTEYVNGSLISKFLLKFQKLKALMK